MADKLRIVTARISPKMAARVDRVIDKSRSRLAPSITELVEWGIESILPEVEEALRLGKARRPDSEILAERDRNEQVIADRMAKRRRKPKR